jgi:hypothetical protein
VTGAVSFTERIAFAVFEDRGGMPDC